MNVIFFSLRLYLFSSWGPQIQIPSSKLTYSTVQVLILLIWNSSGTTFCLLEYSAIACHHMIQCILQLRSVGPNLLSYPKTSLCSFQSAALAPYLSIIIHPPPPPLHLTVTSRARIRHHYFVLRVKKKRKTQLMIDHIHHHGTIACFFFFYFFYFFLLIIKNENENTRGGWWSDSINYNLKPTLFFLFPRTITMMSSLSILFGSWLLHSINRVGKWNLPSEFEWRPFLPTKNHTSYPSSQNQNRSLSDYFLILWIYVLYWCTFMYSSCHGGRYHACSIYIYIQ